MSPEELRYLEWLEDELPTIFTEDIEWSEPQPPDWRKGVGYALMAGSALLALLVVVFLFAVGVLSLLTWALGQLDGVL